MAEHAVDPHQDEKTASHKKVLFIFLVILAIPGLAALLVVSLLFIFAFVYRPFQMAGNSMSPAYKDGSYVISGITRDPKALTRGEIIVFEIPTKSDRDGLKRIIGIPGDTVMLSGGRVFLNGQRLIEPYIPNEVRTFGGAFLQEGESVIVPANSYFVMGDNRPESSDSREYGFVSSDKVISKVLSCYWKC